MTTRTNWTILLVVGAVSLILFHFCVLAGLQLYFRPSECRLPFPPGIALTELVAIEFSKKALLADGKDSAGMLPVPYRDIGQRPKGENVYFAVNTINSNAGYVLWTTRDESNRYCVHLEKVGDEIVCQVSRMQ